MERVREGSEDKARALQQPTIVGHEPEREESRNLDRHRILFDLWKALVRAPIQ